MSDLTVSGPIKKTLKPVGDHDGKRSALWIATEQAQVRGKDVVGGSMPLMVFADPTREDFDEGRTWGRLIRLSNSGMCGDFYDIGIDKEGNLFINSSKMNGVLTIKPYGQLSLNPYGLKPPPPGVETVEVVVDPKTGQLYKKQ